MNSNENAAFENIPFSDTDFPPAPNTDIDNDALAINDFLTSANGGFQIGEQPSDPVEQAPITFDNLGDIDAKGSINHPFVSFFAQKLSQLDDPKFSSEKKYNGFVNKNQKSGWFAEFNESTKDKSPETAIFCKPNSLFYVDSDSISDALTQSGLSNERALALQDKFDFVFIGNTSTRSKQANDKANSKGLKTYVLGLKDPLAPDATEIFNEFKAARDQHIKMELENSKTLDAAVAEVVNNKELITSSVKGPRFYGTEDKLFLNNSATRSFLDTIPGLKGQYAVFPIKHESNKVQYLGDAPKMDSFFSDNIELCEVKALKDGKFSQEELEKKVTEALDGHQGHVMRTPQSSFTKQNEITDAEKIAEKDNVDSTHPKTEKGKRENSESDYEDYKKRKTKNLENDDEEQKKSIAAVLAETAAKLTAASLEALLALAKLIVAMLLALLQLVLKGVSMAAHKINPNIPVREGPSIIKTLDGLQFSKRKGPGKGMVLEHDQNNNEQIDNAKKLELAISENAKTLDVLPEPQLDKDTALKSELTQELEKLKADFTVDKEALAEAKIESFTPENMEEFRAEADTRLDKLSAEEAAGLLNNLEFRAAHNISPELDSKVAERSLYHPDYGVLLAKNDKVLLENGVEAGVLSAFSVAGKLHYATAQEKDGQYSITYTPADKLTLVQHNGIQFDNESNLIEQTIQSIMEKHGADGKVVQVEILDHSSPSVNALSIRELATVSPFISKQKLGFDLSAIDIPELVGRDMKYHAELYKSIPQLHTDLSDDATNLRSGQTHPMFGRMLDINDQVESTLPNGKIKIEGAVVGSYAYNDDLYYQIKSDNQVYNLKAADLSLLKYDGGELSESEITQRAIDKLFIGNGKNTSDSIDPRPLGSIDIPLRHINGPSTGVENELGVYQVQRDLTNSKIIAPGTTNVGITPLNYKDGLAEGSGIIYKMDKGHFVSFGETTDPVTGMKRAVCAEIKKTGNRFSGIPLVKSRMVQLNLDDPSVTIAKNGLSGSEILASVSSLAAKALSIYESGGLKKQAVIMAKFGAKLKSELLADNTTFVDLAKESVIQNEIATKILEAKAISSNLTNSKEIGLDANLGLSAIDLSAVNQQIKTPDATLVMEESPIIAEASTLQPNEIIESTYPHHMPEDFDSLSHQLSLEEQQYDFHLQSIQGVEPSLAPLDIKPIHLDTGVEQVATNPKNDHVVDIENLVQTPHTIEDRDLQSPVQMEEALIENGNPKISTLAIINAAEDVGEGPHSESVKFIATYLTGNQITNNEHGAWDLLSEKAELLGLRNDIFEKSSVVMHTLSPAFQEITFEQGIADFEKSLLSDPSSFQKIFADNPVLVSQIHNLAVSSSNYNELYGEHLEHVTEAISDVNSRFDIKGLDSDALDKIMLAQNALTQDSSEKLNDVTRINNFAYAVSEISSSKENVDFVSLVNTISENTEAGKEHAQSQINAIERTFSQTANKGADNMLTPRNDMMP